MCHTDLVRVDKAHHEVRDQPFVEMHADVRPQTPERVAFVLANGAHERPDAVVAVQVLLGGRRARVDHAAHRTLPAVGRSHTLMALVVSVDDRLQMPLARAISTRSVSYSYRNRKNVRFRGIMCTKV